MEERNEDLLLLKSLAIVGTGHELYSKIEGAYKNVAARDRAYQVIKPKTVDVYWLNRSASLEDYTRPTEDSDTRLTQEEFTFLKEEIQK